MSRTRWWFNPETKEMQDHPYRPPEERSGLQLITDAWYEGARAPDGTDIGSRTKHRNYLKATGLAVADDYKGVWAAAEKKREAIAKGEHEPTNRALREKIERSIAKAKAGYRPRLPRYDGD
jgi:hypothetical protein